MIDIRPQDRIIITTLAKYIFTQKVEIWIYGSRIKGTNHDASDLDMVIKPLNEDEPFLLDELEIFKQALEQSNIPILIQVLSWQHIPQSFKKIIKQRYDVLLRLG